MEHFCIDDLIPKSHSDTRLHAIGLISRQISPAMTSDPKVASCMIDMLPTVANGDAMVNGDSVMLNIKAN